MLGSDSQGLIGRTHGRRYDPIIFAWEETYIECPKCGQTVKNKDMILNMCQKCWEQYLEQLAKQAEEEGEYPKLEPPKD